MKRREFITVLVGAAAWPLAARAQQTGATRKVGILMPYPASDAEIQDRVEALRQELRVLGWRTGENLVLDERWVTDDMTRIRASAAELVAAKPDVIVATGARVIPVLKQQTSSVAIIFVATTDPVGRGLVPSLARPGGNVTGFALSELPIVEKMLEILKQIAPKVRRVTLIFNQDNPASPLNIKSFEEATAKLGIGPVIAPVRHPSDSEAAIEAMAREPDGGALFPSDLTILQQRDVVVAAAARYRLPAIYADRAMVAAGGLISYSADRKYMFRLSAGYVDRILRGESPGELPVQQPTRYELTLNLRTAQSLGLQVSPALLVQADDVIE
jgi:putative tryptophan/tyrosine transport system substrate-binding protein